MADSRTEKYLARSRGQTVNYLPEDVFLVTDETHPCYDERVDEDVEPEMVDDVYTHGVHTPPIVKMYVIGNKERVCVVAGRRRFKAAKLANKRRVAEGLEPRVVECKMRNDLTDDEVREIIVSENEQRRADTLKNKIAKASRMYIAAKEAAELEGEKFDRKATIARIASAFGVPAATISRWLLVPQLAASARGAIYKGDVPLARVNDLARMDIATQGEAVAEIREAKAIGPRQARKVTATKTQAPAPEKQTRRPRSAVEAALATALADRDAAKNRLAKLTLDGVVRGLRWVLGEADDLTTGMNAAEKLSERVDIAIAEGLARVRITPSE